MNVTCNRCGSEYEFEETLVSSGGTTVKCTSCGHLFKVFRAGALPGAADEARPWLIRARNGTIEPLVSLGDLTRLLAEGVYTAEDEISRTGQVWKRLGDITELQSFFSAARRSTAEPRQRVKTPSLGFRSPAPADGAAKAKPGATAKGGSTLRPPAISSPPAGTETKPGATTQSGKLPAAGQKGEPGPSARQSEPVLRLESPTQKQHRPPPVNLAQAPSESEYSHDSDHPTMQVQPIIRASGEEDIGQGAELRRSAEAAKPASPSREPSAAEERPGAGPAQADETLEIPKVFSFRMGWLWWLALAALLAGGAAWLGWPRPPTLSPPPANPPVAGDPTAPFLLRADAALQTDRLDQFVEAVDEYTKALAFREHDAHILSSLSRAHAVWAQALSFSLREIENKAEGNGEGKAEPDSERLARAAALRHELQRNAKRAKHHGQKAAAKNPDNVEAMIALADALRLTGDLKAARSKLDRAHSRKSVPSTEMLRVAALLAIDEADGNMAAGQTFSEKAVEKAPDLIRGRVLLAHCLLAANDRDGARVQVDTVLQKDKNHPGALALKRALEAAAAPAPNADGGVEEAEEDASQVADLDQDGEEKGGEETLEDKQAAIRTASSTGGTYLSFVKQGESSLERGAVARARKSFRSALSLRPHDPRAQTGLGYVELEKGNASQAIRRFQPAAKRGYAEAYIGLGDAYRKLGRKMDALHAFEAYLRFRPNGRDASIARAQVARFREEMQKRAGSKGTE